MASGIFRRDVTSCPQKADHILVCQEGHGLVPRGFDQFRVGLRRAKGALVGASGEIRMTVESHGVQLASRTIKVTVPDAGLVPDRLERTPGTKKVKPGTSMKVMSMPRPASAPPATPHDTEATIAFDVDNTADIQAVGTTVRQKKAGDPVKATVGVRNKGPAGMPAWLGSDMGEDPPYETRVYLPAGTEAVTTPKGCVKFAPRNGAVHYLCFQDTHEAWIYPGQYMTWTFDLRVVDPAALKPGRVKVSSLSTDPDASNNTAAIVVRSPGHGSGAGGAGKGGTGNGGTGNDGASGAAGSGGTSEGKGTGTGTGGATVTGGSGNGAMADTGTSRVVPLAATASALAVLLGGALFAGFRRRRQG
ncbi:hypothetical protein [Streptomyces sp. NPDC053069]|uniref:hypothetical protein n=1 Tax=Streptomyces sp. NPDC053069 TaxID=3365695 RepID=UPI0037D8F467